MTGGATIIANSSVNVCKVLNLCEYEIFQHYDNGDNQHNGLFAIQSIEGSGWAVILAWVNAEKKVNVAFECIIEFMVPV